MFLTDRPTVQEVAYKTYAINCMGMQTPMLFVGTEKALLLDTGCGNSDLRGLVESLTDLPVMVAVTHEHADHVGGIVQFDEVYAPAQDIPRIQAYTTEFMQRFLDFFNDLIEEEPGINGCFRQQKKVLNWDHIPILQPIHDGDSWDLGGRRVTAYHCPVHSKGHMVFVDDASRILYAGDSISDNAGPANNEINPPTYVALETIIRGLEHVQEHKGEYDRVYSGHHGWGGHLARSISYDPAVVDRMLGVARGVMEGRLKVHFEDSPAEGRRNYAMEGPTTLYFFDQYRWDKDIPEAFL